MKFNSFPIEIEKMNKVIDTLKSQNQQLQNKVDSFMVSSANNSFAPDYNENEWYTDKPYRSSLKNFKHNTPGQTSKGYAKTSDSSYQNDQFSRHHRRIVSDDLILEENNESQIEFAKSKPPSEEHIEAALNKAFRDLRYITKCGESETEHNFIKSISSISQHGKLVWDFGQELVSIIRDRAQKEADRYKSDHSMNSIHENLNALKQEIRDVKIEFVTNSKPSNIQRITTNLDEETRAKLLDEKEGKLKYEERYIAKASELDTALREIDKLKNTVESLHRQNIDKEIRSEQESAVQRLIEYQRDNSKLHDRIQLLKSQHERQLQQFEIDLKKEFHEKMFEQKDKMGKQILDEKEIVMNVQSRVNELEAILDTKTEDLKQLRLELDYFKQKHNEYYKEAISLSEQLKYEQLHIQNKTKANNQINKKAFNSDKTTRQLENRLKELERKLAESNNANDNLKNMYETELEHKRCIARKADNDKFESEHLIQKLNSKVRLMQDQIDDLKEAHDEQIGKLRNIAYGQGVSRQLDFAQECKFLKD